MNGRGCVVHDEADSAYEADACHQKAPKAVDSHRFLCCSALVRRGCWSSHAWAVPVEHVLRAQPGLDSQALRFLLSPF